MSANKDIEKYYFQEHKNQIKSILKTLEHIDSDMKKHLPTHNPAGTNYSHHDMKNMVRDSQCLNGLQALTNLTSQSRNLAAALQSYLDEDNSDWTIQKIRNAEISERELDHASKIENMKLIYGKRSNKIEFWHDVKVWGVKMVRWGIGMTLSVILYSTFVYLADKSDDLLIIPGKDWIMQLKS